MFGQIIKDDQRIHAIVHEPFAHGGAGERSQILIGGGIGSGGRDDDRIRHRPLLLQHADNTRDVGLLLPDGLSCNNLADAEVKQALINSSHKIILCMDSSKIGRAYLARFAALDVVDVLISDNGISDESREAIEQQQIEIITVSAEVPASLHEFELIRDDVAV